MWRFYLSYCEAGFYTGDLDVLQSALNGKAVSLTNASVRAPARRRLLGGLMCGLMAPLLVGGMLRTRPARAMTSSAAAHCASGDSRSTRQSCCECARPRPARPGSTVFATVFTAHSVRREIQSRALIDRTIEEMRALKAGSAEQHAAWTRALNGIFPTVGEGDELVGEHVPGLCARFQFNGRPVGEVATRHSRGHSSASGSTSDQCTEPAQALLGLATP